MTKGLLSWGCPTKTRLPLRLDFGGDSIVLWPDVALSTTMVLNKDMRSQLPAIIDSLGDLFGKPIVSSFVKPIEDYVDSICWPSSVQCLDWSHQHNQRNEEVCQWAGGFGWWRCNRITLTSYAPACNQISLHGLHLQIFAADGVRPWESRVPGPIEP